MSNTAPPEGSEELKRRTTAKSPAAFTLTMKAVQCVPASRLTKPFTRTGGIYAVVAPWSVNHRRLHPPRAPPTPRNWPRPLRDRRRHKARYRTPAPLRETEPRCPASSHRGDDLRRAVDPPDAMIAQVGDEEVARTVHRHAGRDPQACAGGRPTIAAEPGRPASGRRGDDVRRGIDSANAIVVGVSDEEVALRRVMFRVYTQPGARCRWAIWPMPPLAPAWPPDCRPPAAS
jgi:hypothetical protein